MSDATGTSGEPQLPVLYDADCGFCRWSIDKVLAWDRRERLRPVAIQSEEGRHLLRDLPPERRLDSWHLVQPSGRVLSAGAAAAALADALPFGGPLARLFRRFPRATESAYRWVSAHRGRLARLVRADTSDELRR